VTTQTQEASETTPRAPLSRERILSAALAYVDQHGLGGLTMHKLAAELGVGAMSLYNHVRNKDDLLTGLGDLIWEEVATGAPPVDDDATWLRALGRAIRDAGRHHPNALPAVAGTGVLPVAVLEVAADQSDRAGSAEPEPRLVNGICTVAAFAIGWALFESSGVGPGAGRAQETERQRIRRVTRALPPDTPDRLVDTAIALCASDAEAMFAGGLEAVINGCGLGDTPAKSRARRPAGKRSG